VNGYPLPELPLEDEAVASPASVFSLLPEEQLAEKPMTTASVARPENVRIIVRPR
jgi:hypothetical protein